MIDEKRREVAENLRYLTIGHSIQYKEQFFDELAEAVVGCDDFHHFNVVLDKLADLIDRPTCHDTEERVDSPSWYTSGGVETIYKIERVIDGLPAVQAYALGQVLRYFDRAGKKDATETDLGKANNYAHRLVTGKWRDDDE